MGGYDALAALAEREARAARDGDLETVAMIVAERRALVATLPPIPPAEARPALERAAAAQHATSSALHVGLAQTRADLERLDRGGARMRAYAGPAERLVDASS